ncbi:hypothetical protein RND81_14G095000 [Saponaria officinalis]|uniref:SHSP domain-containing protein n=1 Tax=Saponaria officinalis TaxID=3572 RepID=A0AAW1GUB7_SAPOF
MASAVLTCLASPILSNKATSSPSKAALLPQPVIFRGLASPKTTPCSRVSSLVVRALPDEGGPSKEISHVDLRMRKDLSHVDPLLQLNLNMSVPMVDTSPNAIRIPWSTSEDENKMRMWFDMPGLTAEGIDVNVENDVLIVKGKDSIDATGRKFDCKLQLPVNCAKEETEAVLKNGALYITVPKIPKSEQMKSLHVPVKVIT